MSMLHQQTLLSSSSSPPSSSFLSQFRNPNPLRLPYSRSSQAEKERRMESVGFSVARQHQGFVDGGDDDDVAWAVEKGSFLGGEDFLVDDLLDLGELETEEQEEEDQHQVQTQNQKQQQEEEKEVEKQEQQKEEEEEEEEQEEEEEAVIREENKSCSSSALTFEKAPSPVSYFTLPAHDDVADLEWVSRVVDDSFSEVPTYEAHHHLQAAVPPPPPAAPVRARRSKRARTVSRCSWSSSSHSSWDEGTRLVFLDSSASSSTTTTNSSAAASCSSSSYSSQLMFSHQLFDEIPPQKPVKKQQQGPKKRGRKPKSASGHGTAVANGVGGERRCSHCGVNKTPQWRTGPTGAKTLCNACGVRYKSGRLLPEYRPACSPTFVSHVHSNSHRKVLEMRRKKEEEVLLVSSATPVASF